MMAALAKQTLQSFHQCGVQSGKIAGQVKHESQANRIQPVTTLCNL